MESGTSNKDLSKRIKSMPSGNNPEPKLHDEKILRILQVLFENDIRAYEIPAFRGAVSRIAGFQNILFHNHEGDNFRYSYPLIQYKTVNDKPLVLCIEEGVNEAHHFFENIQEGILLGSRPYELRIESLNLFRAELYVDSSFHHYSLINWLPFNRENYARFKAIRSQVEQVIMLEKILVGNILSLAKGVSWRIDQQINVRITHVGDPKPVSVKSVKRMAISIYFLTNVVLPDYIGLGKNVSSGYGTLNKEKSNKDL